MSFKLLLVLAWLGASHGFTSTHFSSHMYRRALYTSPRSIARPASNTISRHQPIVTMEAAADADSGLASGLVSDDASPLYKAFVSFSDKFTTLFPVWTLLVAVTCVTRPATLAWFTTSYFTAALAILMLSMGITLSPDDFARVAQRPVPVILQFLQCYALMPLVALGIGKGMGLDAPIVAGLVLVGCINGGQASNLCTYIARGDVALSVLMTTMTTIGAIFMTPFLCKLLLGTVVPVDARGVALSTIQVVLAPIVAGMSINKFFPKQVKKVLPVTPVVGVVSTCLLVGSAVGQVSAPILNAGIPLQVAAALLHLVGGFFAYGTFKLAKFDETTCRTTAIETSMKSSAFGFLLAKLHFGDYLARVPAAVSVVWMALIGSSLAVLFRFLPAKDGSGKK